MRSWTRRPTALSTNAVTIADSRPKHRFNERATLYSPPPSYTSNLRVVQIRLSPGSNRNMTSPRAMRSHRHPSFGFVLRITVRWPPVLERGHGSRPEQPDMLTPRVRTRAHSFSSTGEGNL